jgi:NAD(P)-dependent dehydrogenase (short-subunit alcohol dehydrogenase family)
MSNLTNKAALVTGGSRGIGAAIAKRLAAEGASVAITYSKGSDAAASVAKAIQRDGGRAIAIQADAADADAVRAADVLRIENGILMEHWDVIQDESTREQSKSGLPMFGDQFPR